jgi:hypothetical protein
VSLIHSSEKKLVLLVFGFFILINIASSGGHLDWWDGTEAFLVTESMALKHTAKLDPFVPSVKELNFNVSYTVHASFAGQKGNNPSSNSQNITLEPVYIVRSLLLSAAAVPFYYAALVFSISPVEMIGLHVNSLFISLTAVVIFCISTEILRSRKIAFVLSLIYCVCSFVWPYNTSFWAQPLQGLLLASSTYFLLLIRHQSHSFLCSYTISRRKRSGFFLAGLAGLFLGLSVFAHPTSLIFIPAFLVYSFFSAMRRQKRSFIIFLSILGVVLLFVGLINYARFGSVIEFGYGYFSSMSAHDGWRGLIGLLISPGAGLIFYFPLSILLPLGAKYMLKENKALFFLCIYIIVANWIYTGTLSFGFEPMAWSGGVAWGPRYLVPVLPFMVIILGHIFTHVRKGYFIKSLLIGLCLAGFYINLSGILVWFQYGLMFGWAVESLSIYPNSLDIMTWFPIYSPIILHTKALMTDYVSTINPEQYVNTSWHWVTYGNAPCRYNLFIYCNLGDVPFLITNTILIIMALSILNQIRIFPFSRVKKFFKEYITRKHKKIGGVPSVVN